MDCSAPVQTSWLGSPSLKGFKALASVASTLGIKLEFCWDWLLLVLPWTESLLLSASKAADFLLELAPSENEPLLEVSVLEDDCWPPFPFPFPPNFLLPFPELEFSFLGKLDLVVESLLSSELASFPESTDEFFFTLLGFDAELVSSLLDSLTTATVDFFLLWTSSNNWKQSGPHGSVWILSSGPRRLVEGPGWFDWSLCKKQSYLKHLLQNNVWKLCMVFACGTDSASLESILGVHSFGTMDLSSESSMYFSLSSWGVPLSEKWKKLKIAHFEYRNFKKSTTYQEIH